MQFLAGAIHGQLTHHPVQAVLDNDLAGMVGRFLEGVEISEDSLAVDLINQVGPIPGEFLSSAHTRKWWRSEQYIPSAADTLTYPEWLATGKKSSLEYARERVEQILATHETEPLPDSVEADIQKIMAEARKYYNLPYVSTPGDGREMNMENKLFAVERLQKFVQEAFSALGVPEGHARIGAARMIEADLWGMHGHGVFRLDGYVRRIEEGGYNLAPQIQVKRETPVSALVDGDNGLGQVVVTKAVELGIKKAKENGLAWIGIGRSNHAGAGGVYAAMGLPHDLIAVYMAIGNANHMAPWGGVDLLLSTNPMAIAVPAGQEPPVVLDMATTVASFGKVKVKAQKGEPLPTGWMIDRRGEPLTDPDRIKEGFLLPIGGHKGFGLNLIIGALAGVLNSAAFGSAVIDFNKDFKTPTNTGQVFIAVRPDLFRDRAEFKAEMDMRLREIRESTPMEGNPPIRIPGEMALRREKEMRREGIPVAPKVLEQLQALARKLELEDRLED